MTGISWGDVWWAEVPHAGRRPVVVLTRPEAIESLPVVLVAPATTNVRHLPTEVHLDADDGMPLPCVINLDTPELVPKGILVDRITRLGDARMMDVCRALATATNC
jgi:mRNA interferase MazF